MHGRNGRDMYIDIPIGTLVYKIRENKTITEKEEDVDEEVVKSFEDQMYAHLGSQYDEIKASEEALEEEEVDTSSEIIKELIFDSSYSQPSELYCIAKGGKGGEGNNAWYERSKRQNLRNWGSQHDRRLQATYYKVNAV